MDFESLARQALIQCLKANLDQTAWGPASEALPKFASRPVRPHDRRHKGHAFFGYADNYLIDLKA